MTNVYFSGRFNDVALAISFLSSIYAELSHSAYNEWTLVDCAFLFVAHILCFTFRPHPSWLSPSVSAQPLVFRAIMKGRGDWKKKRPNNSYARRNACSRRCQLQAGFFFATSFIPRR